jgi:hypothetical protein
MNYINLTQHPLLPDHFEVIGINGEGHDQCSVLDNYTRRGVPCVDLECTAARAKAIDRKFYLADKVGPQGMLIMRKGGRCIREVPVPAGYPRDLGEYYAANGGEIPPPGEVFVTGYPTDDGRYFIVRTMNGYDIATSEVTDGCHWHPCYCYVKGAAARRLYDAFGDEDVTVYVNTTTLKVKFEWAGDYLTEVHGLHGLCY